MAELLDWVGGVDPSQIGFPFPLDRSLYHKRTEIPFKQTPGGPLHLDAYLPSWVERARADRAEPRVPETESRVGLIASR